MAKVEVELRLPVSLVQLFQEAADANIAGLRTIDEVCEHLLRDSMLRTFFAARRQEWFSAQPLPEAKPRGPSKPPSGILRSKPAKKSARKGT